MMQQQEPTNLMEPMLVSSSSRYRPEFTDLALELMGISTGLCRSLPEDILIALARLVRSMNCYYSNLIEEHNTHPVDIERALKNDYSADSEKRNLQLEAKAHVEVQQWIDEGNLSGRTTTMEGICEIHRRFCELLPGELLYVENPDTGERSRVIPGKLREKNVQVGQHIAVSPDAVSRFMARFEQAYTGLGKTEAILATAAAHHRLVWIHPFMDGNGRVARLMSHAMLLDILDTGGIWSIARGLARTVAEYKSHLANCDLPRRNDLDGRGSLSEEALAKFTKYFFETCIDQVKFMESLIQPDRMRDRVLIWVNEEIRAGTLPSNSDRIMEAILYRGKLHRGDVADFLGCTDRHARRITSALVKAGVLTSESSRSPLYLVFSAKLASRWMPGLFPEQR